MDITEKYPKALNGHLLPGKMLHLKVWISQNSKYAQKMMKVMQVVVVVEEEDNERNKQILV
jgi:hypothetical protein